MLKSWQQANCCAVALFFGLSMCGTQRPAFCILPSFSSRNRLLTPVVQQAPLVFDKDFSSESISPFSIFSDAPERYWFERFEITRPKLFVPPFLCTFIFYEQNKSFLSLQEHFFLTEKRIEYNVSPDYWTSCSLLRFVRLCRLARFPYVGFFNHKFVLRIPKAARKRFEFIIKLQLINSKRSKLICRSNICIFFHMRIILF